MNQKIVILLIMLGAFLVLSLGVLGLLNSIDQRQQLLREFEAERTAFEVMELIRLDAFSSLEEYNLLGVGIYTPEGEAVNRWGRAPKTLALANREMMDISYHYDLEKGTLTFLRPMRPMGFRPEPGHMEGRNRNLRRLMGFLFLELDIASDLKGMNIIQLLRILLPLMLFIVMGIIYFLILKNREYRERLGAQARLARLGEISRTFSHELKNPLSAIRLQTAYLKKVLPLENHHELDIIEEETLRLTSLSDFVRDFVRDPLGKGEWIDLHAFLSELIKRFSGEINMSNYLESGEKIFFNRERLRSVVENIVKNGLESYSSSEKRLEIDLGREGEWILLSVRDEGEGLPEGWEEKVMEPEFSTKPSGSGIGLSIARRFVEARKGKLEIFPRDHKGTEVKIFFLPGEQK